jgi:hypothetical protein
MVFTKRLSSTLTIKYLIRFVQYQEFSCYENSFHDIKTGLYEAKTTDRIQTFEGVYLKA